MLTRVRIGLFACVVAVMGLFACMGEQGSPVLPEATSRTTKAVVGGKPDARYPSIGSLQANRSSFCTGTLIASRLVITAAHCITSAQSQQARGANIQFRIDMPNGNSFTPTYHAVKTLAYHPQYGQTRQGIQNDLGYMVLDKDVTGVSPMPLNTTALDSKWVGRKILFLGYGVIQTQPSRRSPGQKYGAEITLRQVQSDRFQTQDTGISICSGDSGGPAMYSINGQVTLIGVNSYVTGRTSGGQPLCDGAGWSFRVDAYMSWIKPLVDQHGGKCKADTDCGPCYKCDTTKGTCVVKGTTPAKTYCQPCKDASQCGGNGNVCQRQSKGYRCLQACDANGCCPLGTSCRVVNNQKQCVPDQDACTDVSCQTDADCGPGEGCTNGTCQPKNVLPSPQLCGKCATDADCEKGASCRTYLDGKYCTQPCVADNFCPTGYTCQDIGSTRQCVPTDGNCKCKADSDCHTGYACQSNICQRAGGGKYGDACDNVRKCATGYTCQQSTDGQSRSCFQACATDYPPGTHGSACASGSCKGGGRCFGVGGVGYLCLQQCTNASTCTYGGTCTSRGSVSICSCNTDADCKAGNVCNKTRLESWGVCAPKNTNQAKCDAGFDCVYAGGSTELCLPGASQDEGEVCDTLKRCKAGLSCARTSTGQSYCFRFCSNQASCTGGGECLRVGRSQICSCQRTDSCATGFVCKSVAGIKTCTPATCKTDADCPAGTTCDNNKCLAKPECTKDSDCPAGKRCENQKCVDLPPTPEPPQTEPVDYREPKPEPTSPEPVTPTEKPSVTGEPTVNGDAGVTDTGAPTPPSSGCNGCSTGSHTPSNAPLGWLLLLLLPLGFKRRQKRS